MNCTGWSHVAVGIALMIGCGGPRSAEEPAGSAAAPAAVAPSPAAHDAAVAEVSRLRAAAETNPLLAAWSGPHGGVPPWDKATVAAVPPAFTAALAALAAEVQAIATDPEAPTFANTFVALEDSGRHLDRVNTLFSVMSSSLNTPDVQALDREWAPKLQAAFDAITFNAALFARIQAIYDGRASAGLAPDQVRLVELTYDRFVQAGARLTAAQKERLGAINQQLSVLFSDFSTKVQNDEETWVVLETPADLAGLPDTLRASYKAAADERKLPGKWAVVNTRSSVDPFLTSSTRRDLREKVWKAFKNRGDNGNGNDTNGLIGQIVALRAERAALLGFPTHAHWRMSDTMAKDPARAQELMMKVWPAAVARVREEVADMQKVADREKAKITIEPWDYLFYAEKVRKARYALDGDALKPYFELNNMIKASMWMAERLYGLGFREITGTLPVFHPDVRVWEVTDAKSGAHVGLFYGDYFARSGKRSGAWMTSYRVHETFLQPRTPIVSNNNNFVKGAPGEPVLISLDDAETLFHEFGHAIHYLVSNVAYPGLSNTPRDFVEYPSQVHEMWVMSAPVLDKFALHYRTGKPMPKALIAKVDAAQKFNTGYATVEYLSSAIVDMALHTLPDGKVDADAFERDTLQKIGAPKEVTMRHRLPQFLHLFSDDSYSAGYYSYLWSEVMDADTREAFAEAGDVFDPKTAEKMKAFILAPGNSTDRAEAFRKFRGRDPDVGALLKKRGFPASR